MYPFYYCIPHVLFLLHCAPLDLLVMFHYIVKDGKIVFPYTLENPYKTKPYLSKVLKTIMDNAGVEFQLVDHAARNHEVVTVGKIDVAHLCAQFARTLVDKNDFVGIGVFVEIIFHAL